MNNIATILYLSSLEAAASLFLGLALFGIRPRWRKIFIMGLLQGTVVYIIRLVYAKLSLPLGTHMFFSLASYVLIVRIMTRINWGISVAAALISFISIALSELIIWPLIFRFSSLTYEQIISNPVSHTVAVHVGDSLMYLLAFVVGVTGFSFIRTKI